MSTVSEQTSLSYRIPSPVPQTASMIQIWSMDTSCPGDMGQITTHTKGRGMRFDLALLTDFESVQLQWCPRGGSTETSSSASASGLNGSSTCLERLGLLAALSTQGQLRIYDIPKPSSAKRVSSAAADDLVFRRFSLHG